MRTTPFWYRDLTRLLIIFMILQPIQSYAQSAPQAPAPPPKVFAQTNRPAMGAAFSPATGAAPAARSAQPRPLIQPKGPADPTDPYIAAKAKALNNDPNQIFAFVRDQIRFEAYYGSVRGARGALWSKGANALDRASLLIALLGASNIQAQYVQGQIDFPAFSMEIGGAFPAPSRVAGCLPVGTNPYDPRNDGNLYNSVSGSLHFWVEFGPGNTPADANFKTSQIGMTFGTANQRFTSVPANLRQQVTLRLKAELFSLASGLFEQGPNTQTVLTQTFDTADLVGRPVTVGNFVHAQGASALDFTAQTFTYTPYFLVGQGGPDVSADPITTGQDYQELYTNFPLGSSVLTGYSSR